VRPQSTPQALLSALGACWLAACSFPEYAFQPDGAHLSSICADGLPSAAETGIDCGGGCPPCGTGEACLETSDCVTLACFDGMCRQPACDDGVRNGAETDTDCGGQCGPCGVGHDCSADQDCESRVCLERACEVPTCLDAVRNGTESSIDCGGACDDCPLGAACNENGDCVSGRCSEQVCVSAECIDGIVNGTETDEDCGGQDCTACEAGQACLAAGDCVSLICDATDRCTAPQCNDQVLNGDESDLDCGSANCPGCADLRGCRSGADCASNTCQSGLCVPAAPTGEQLSPVAWLASASHTFPEDEPGSAIDGTDSVWSTGTQQAVGMWFELDLGGLEAFFSIEMTCNIVDDVPARFEVYFSTDGDFEGIEPARADMTGFSPTTTIEFATAQVARYVRFVLSEGKPRWWCIEEIRLYE
jgi:hypothetical protein